MIFLLSIWAIPLFDGSLAALTGGLIERSDAVWLTGTVQEVTIEVDEKGTTAAAVAVMSGLGAGMPEPTPLFEMNCNTPFVFILSDRTYDGGEQILFTGVVNNPE